MALPTTLDLCPLHQLVRLLMHSLVRMVVESTGYGTGLGSHNMTATAKDKAGNSYSDPYFHSAWLDS